MKKRMAIIVGALALALGISTTNSTVFAATSTGWKSVSGHMYYYTAKGKATGWLTIGGKKYYFDSKGIMKTGWVTIAGKKYYFDSKGVMKTGWVTIAGKKYYFDSTGVMKTGWVTVVGKKYYFDSTGVMKTGWVKVSSKSYYLNASGIMQTGWQTIGGKQYYFYSTGIMAVNTMISGKIIGSDGAVKPSTPLNKALYDATAAGVVAKVQADGSYNLYKSNISIGDFDPVYGVVEGNNQFTSLFEKMSLDLGFQATAVELKSLVDQVQKEDASNYNVFDDGKTVFINWSPKVPTATAPVLKALSDIQAAGVVAKPGADGTYNLFKNNVYVGYLNPDQKYPAVEGNGSYAALLQAVALDLGYTGTSTDLQNLVHQAMYGSNNDDYVYYDGYTLSISW